MSATVSPTLWSIPGSLLIFPLSLLLWIMARAHPFISLAFLANPGYAPQGNFFIINSYRLLMMICYLINPFFFSFFFRCIFDWIQLHLGQRGSLPQDTKIIRCLHSASLNNHEACLKHHLQSVNPKEFILATVDYVHLANTVSFLNFVYYIFGRITYIPK